MMAGIWYKFLRRHYLLSSALGGSIPPQGGPGVREGIGIPPASGAAPRGNWWLWRQPARCPFASIACGSIPLHDGQAHWEFGSRLWWCWRPEAFCNAPHGAAHLGVLLRTGIRFAGCTAPAHMLW